MSRVHEHNRRAWDHLVRQKHVFTVPGGDDQISDPLAAVAADEWLGGNVRGRRMLCLAAGGGKCAVKFAAAGATVTVVDLSPQMLALDRQVAAELGLTVRTIETSMDDLSPLADSCFDIVVQPVSSCYVPDILAVYREVARVTSPGGVYISQHKQPASLQGATQPSSRGYELIEPYYRHGSLPAVSGSRHRETGTLEFLHRWEQIIGGMCRSGFVIEDLVEPLHNHAGAEPGTFQHRSRYMPPYVRIKARRTGPNKNHRGCAEIWTASKE